MRNPQRKRRGRAVRLRRGEVVAAAGAVVLLVSMFFPWYDVTYSGGVRTLSNLAGVGRTAWQTLGLISALLALAAVVALGVTLLRLLGSRWKPAIVPGAAVAVCGGAAALLALFRILVPPGLGAIGGIELEATPNLGAFVGFGAAIAIACGGYRAMREEGSSFAAVADSLQPRREPPASKTRSRSSSG